MWQLSAGAQAALSAQVQTYAAKADILDPNGTILATVDVEPGGAVDIDATSSIRRSLRSLSLIDTTGQLVPRVAKDILDPRSGNELRVWSGIVLRDSTEWVPLITARLSRPQISEDDGGLRIRVDGYDRSRQIARALWSDVFTIGSNVNVGTALRNMLTSRYPNIPCSIAETSDTISWRFYGLQSDGDPWQDIQDLAATTGWKVIIDPMGVAVAAPVPDPSTAATVWDYVEDENCTVVEWSRELPEDDTYSGVLLTAESVSDGTSFSAEAWDTDPNSPTYYLGPFGKIPKRISVTGIQTQGQANKAAKAQLVPLLGLSEQDAIVSSPNPALDADDVVTLRRVKLGINTVATVQSITMPVGPGTMSVSYRTRRVL